MEAQGPGNPPAGGFPGACRNVLPRWHSAGMETAEHLAALSAEGELLARAASRIDHRATAGAHCVLRATASDLHLQLWNRPSGPVAVTGDPAVLAEWARQVRVRWGGPGPRSARPAPA